MLLNKQIPQDLFYTKEHEWISKKKINNNFFFIGITNYAQEQLGDIVFLDIFKSKKLFKQGEILGEIESVKSVGSIIAPINGYIIEINNIVLETPEIINNDPFNNGWILKYKIQKEEDLIELLNPRDYLLYLETLV